MSKTRHPTKKKCRIPTPSPSMISIGTREKKILQYMINLENERFNIKAYSRISKIARTTLNDTLKRLIDKGLIERPCYAKYVISEKGKSVLEALFMENRGVGNLRRGCRDKVTNLSSHYLQYKIRTQDLHNLNKSKLKELNPIKIKELKLRNLEITYLYFEDATIIIQPKQILIRIHDIITKDTDEMHFKTFEKALSYSEKLESIGVKTICIELESGHYARVESILADTLHKIDKRYFLDLGNGRKFWIDCSGGKLEDETTDPQARTRLDNSMTDIMNRDKRYGEVVDDIERIADVLHYLSQIEVARHKREVSRAKEISKRLENNEGASYFG